MLSRAAHAAEDAEESDVLTIPWVRRFLWQAGRPLACQDPVALDVQSGVVDARVDGAGGAVVLAGEAESAVVGVVERLVLVDVLLHGGRRPRGVACQRRPVVVVLVRAAHVHHVVDAGGTTQQLAAWHVVNAVARAGL